MDDFSLVHVTVQPAALLSPTLPPSVVLQPRMLYNPAPSSSSSVETTPSDILLQNDEWRQAVNWLLGNTFQVLAASSPSRDFMAGSCLQEMRQQIDDSANLPHVKTVLQELLDELFENDGTPEGQTAESLPEMANRMESGGLLALLQ